MSYSNRGSFCCPCCGTQINLIYDEVGCVIDINFFVPKKQQEETPTEGPGNLRPGNLSKKVHEGLHGKAPSDGSAKAKFDRNGYQRELMRKRRAEARKPKV